MIYIIKWLIAVTLSIFALIIGKYTFDYFRGK